MCFFGIRSVCFRCLVVLFFSLFCLAMCYFLSLPTYRILFCLPTHIFSLVCLLPYYPIMNEEDTELCMAPQSASKTWRGRCMWAFENGGGPALRHGEGVDLISERSVCVKFQALLSKKDGSYLYSRQHSIGCLILLEAFSSHKFPEKACLIAHY
jgi:hypothetical protein